MSDRLSLLRRRVPRSSWGGGVLLCGLLLGAGCSNDFFVCSEDSQCTEAEGGRCEASGACSFPDPQCPTGRRYGEAGNPQVAETCVPPEDLGSSSATDSSQGASQSSSTGHEATSSTSVGSDSGTSGAQESSSGGTSTGPMSESSSGGASSSSSTGNPPPPPDLYEPCEGIEDCSNMTCASFYDQNGAVLAGFCTAAGCEDATLDCTDPGTGAVPSCEPVPLNGAPGNGCVLDCTETGAAGCPAGMTCLQNIAGLPDLCAHLL